MPTGAPIPVFRSALLFALIALFTGPANAQTFTNTTGGFIPDDGPQVSFPITVSGLSPATINTTFGLETVCINLTHPWDADLTIQLKAPDGTVVDLAMNVGGDGDDFTNTCFNQGASVFIGTAGAPFTGTFRPSGQMGYINNGQNANGTWKLLVEDHYGGDFGWLEDVSITFGNAPAQLFAFTGSSLPLVIINTNGAQIQDEPKTLVQMGIIDNGAGNINHPTDPWNDYNGWAGIEYRGSTSQGFPQKPYGFETWDADGNDTSVSLLGMPEESDWILNATYNDKSLMRNPLTYDLFRAMGRYAPRTRFCEVLLNGQYQGVYVLMEKVKRDSARVDIAKLKPDDLTGDDVTGGYIVKIDKYTGSGNGGWTSNYDPVTGNGSQHTNFQYHYPKAGDIQPQQEAYIQAYVDSFEKALKTLPLYDTTIGYRRYADVGSFVDYFLINEVSRNVDGYRISSFLYKDKASKGGKLVAGPPWDYNLAWWNADYCNAASDTGWGLNTGVECANAGDQPPFWWYRLMDDTSYNNALRCRWDSLRQGVMSNTHLFSYIDSTAAVLNDAQARHFTAWPVMGVYVWPNPSPLAFSYAEEITHLKDWIALRMTWLDANIPGTCWPKPVDTTDTSTMVALLPPAGDGGLRLYPNPATDQVNAEVNAPVAGNVAMMVYDAQGRCVLHGQRRLQRGRNAVSIGVAALPAGLYHLHISGADVDARGRFLKR